MLKTFHIVKSRQGVYMYMLVFSNVGFMGMPILQSACGENGSTTVFYVAVFNIYFNPFFINYYSFRIVIMH